MEKFKVFLTDVTFPIEFPSHETILEQGRAHGLELEILNTSENTTEALIRDGADADVVINSFTPVTKEFIDSLQKCKLIIRIAIGVDTIDVDAATARGIRVANVPDYCWEEVAVHTMALLLSIVRNIPPRNQALKEGAWRPPQVAYDCYLPRLSKKVMAICGFGNIARQLALRAKPFMKELWAYDPYLSDEVFEQYGVKRIRCLEEIWPNADVISLNLPLTKETYHLVDASVFAQMKPTAVLLNTARGAIIDEAALCNALENGAIAGAGLDVFETEPLPGDSPLRRQSKAVLTAHQGSASEESLPQLMQSALDEVYRALKNEPLRNWYNRRAMEA